LPTYEYRCADCNHQFERFQKMSDDPVAECEACGGPVQRIFFPVAIHFKGSGFYTTDYARKKPTAASGSTAGSKDAGGAAAGGSGDSNGSNGSSSEAKTEAVTTPKKDDKVSSPASSKD